MVARSAGWIRRANCPCVSSRPYLDPRESGTQTLSCEKVTRLGTTRSIPQRCAARRFPHLTPVPLGFTFGARCRLRSRVVARNTLWPHSSGASVAIVKVLDIPKSGKCGNTVWQSNRYGQYSYPAFIPFNPRTPAQVAVRGTFGAVSARWRELDQAQRDVWCAVARTMKSKPRLGQCGPLTGFLLFVKVNVPLANRGMAQVDLPTEGRSQNEECRNLPPKAVTRILDRVFVSRPSTGWRGTLLKIP